MADLRRHIPALAQQWQAETPDAKWRQFDGTLCFADISGFTALAERLAQRGRVGGEELVETLSRVFSQMLDVADQRGGSLLKFGGDALLLFFQGEDHVAQAASAAVEMRAALREAARIPTSVGPLKLSMSVGLHAGSVDCFLVGSTHKELVLLGPATNKVVEVEGLAQAGQILVSADTAQRLPRHAVRPREDGELLLRWRKAAVPPCGARPLPDLSDEMVAQLFPVDLGEYLSRDVPDPEHRVACIAFVKFGGADALLARHGPLHLAEALERTIGFAMDCFAQEGIALLAVDVDADGGKLFLGAGVPFKHEDDEGDMLRALRRIAAEPLPMDLKFGVNRGHVFAAEVGSPRRAAYSAMGDTTNTAARIMGKAPQGEIYAHPSVLDECLTLYEVTPSPPLTMKGKKAPLVVYQLGDSIGVREREGLGFEDFFGRAEELAIVASAIEKWRTGSGSVVLVEAEPGMGKSALLRESLARADLQPTLWIRGEPAYASSAYRALRDPMRAMLGIERASQQQMNAALEQAIDEINADLRPWLALLGVVLQIDVTPSEQVVALDPKFRPQRTAEVLIELLQAQGRLQVLMFDDAQWLDEASNTLLEQLARVAEAQCWLVLVARRPEQDNLELQSTARIELAPMDDRSVRELVLALTEAAPLRPYEMDMVVRRAGGSPLFAREIIKAAREVGSVEAVPQSLEAAMAAQVDALDQDARRVLRYASVLGRSFPRLILGEILEADGYQLDAAVLARLETFITDGDAGFSRFLSSIVRDTTYEGLAYRTRSRLHRLAGDAIERAAPDPTSVANILAMHFARAGDQARTWRYAMTAAQKARDAYANVEAANLYQTALAAVRGDTEVDRANVVSAQIELGKVLRYAGKNDESAQAFSRAIKQADDLLVQARVLNERAAVKSDMGAYVGASRDVARALKLLEGLDTAPANVERARLMAASAVALMTRSRPAQARDLARLAEQAAARAGDDLSRAKALIVIEESSLQLEGPGDGARLLEALQIFESLGELELEASAKDSLGFLHAHAGRWREAVQWFEAACEAYRRRGDEVSHAYISLNFGEMLVKQRRWSEALPILEEAVRTMRASGFEVGVAIGQVQLAIAQSRLGDPAEADQEFQRLVDYFDHAGQKLIALEALSARCVALAAAGRGELAKQALTKVRKPWAKEWEVQLPLMTLAEGRALQALTDYQQALTVANKGLDAARARGMPYEEALLLELVSELRAALGMEGKDQQDAARRILLDLGVSLS